MNSIYERINYEKSSLSTPRTGTLKVVTSVGAFRIEIGPKQTSI